MSALHANQKGFPIFMITDIATDRPYGLARPRVADLQACIIRAGGDAQLWSQLCEAADVPADTDDPAAVSKLITAALTLTTGTVGVAVASVNIRLRAHTALTAAR